jgi:AAA domain
VEPDLVVIDPIVSFIGSDTDMNRQNDVRAILGPLAKLAQQCNVPILIVAHARKSGSGKAMHTLMGSVDFSAAVRSVLHVTLDPDDDDVSIVSHGKSNLARRGASLRFRVDDEGAFQWLGEDDRTADELTGAPRILTQRRERERAEDLLRDLLASGPQLQTVIQEHAKANGISDRTLQRAKKSLDITSRQLKGPAEKAAFCVEPGTTAWVWELPTPVRQAA